MRALTRPLLLALALAVGVSACATPEDLEEEAGRTGEAPIAASTPDPSALELARAVDDLETTLVAARERILVAAEASGVDAARAAGRDALAQLLVDPPASGGASAEGLPLFPTASLERGDEGDASDQLTVTATAARDAGAAGGPVLDLLRDPLAGDLGSWQRDPEGVIASIDETIGGAQDLDALDAAIFELPGLGTRAVAWARLTADASDADLAAEYAQRGAAHLEVVIATLETIAGPVRRAAE